MASGVLGLQHGESGLTVELVAPNKQMRQSHRSRAMPWMSATKWRRVSEGVRGGGGEASTVYASQPGRASGVNGWMEGAKPAHEGLVMEDGKSRRVFNGIKGSQSCKWKTHRIVASAQFTGQEQIYRT